MNDGGINDPVLGDSLWNIGRRIFRKVRSNQSKLDYIDNTSVSQVTVDSMYSKIDDIESLVAHESTIDTISSKICVLDSKIDLLDMQIGPCCCATPIDSATTITASGPYCLAQDIQGTITIDADNVMLDLNCYAITNASYGIVINDNYSDITMQNGTVGGGTSTTQVGISVGSGCSRISMKDINVVDCELVAMDFSGISSSPIKTIDITRCCIENSGMGIQTDNVQGGLIRQCSMSYNITGMYFDESEKLVVEDCHSFANERAGFELKISSNNFFRNCKAIKNGETGSDNGFGFVASDGFCNTFQNCLAQDTKTNLTGVSKMAVGFALTGTEQQSTIVDCTSKKTQAIATGGSSLAKSFGVYLEGTTQKCVVRDSLMTGTTGDVGGIGCEADGSANLIIRNIGYDNDTNFGSSITNVHTGGLGTEPKALDNLSFPPL